MHKTIDGAYPQVGFHITTCFSGDCEFGDAISSARDRSWSLDLHMTTYNMIMNNLVFQLSASLKNYKMHKGMMLVMR